MQQVRAITIGWRARAALARADERVTVHVPLSASVYAAARDDLVWLGAPEAPLHGRAILCDGIPPVVAGDVLAIEGATAATWHPPTPPSARKGPTLIAHARALRARAAVLGSPEGFGAAWTGPVLPAPLRRAGAYAKALGAACAAGQAADATRAAIALLGVGGGLTPSGDDYVGGAFFARALLAAAHGADAAWRTAAGDVVAALGARTHPISAALLADHVEGHGHAPLHALACALAEGDDERAIVAARRLVTLGHTSGWDIVAGFFAGLGVG